MLQAGQRALSSQYCQDFSCLAQAKRYLRLYLSVYLGIFRAQGHLNIRRNKNKIYKWGINKLVVFSDLQKAHLH